MNARLLAALVAGVLAVSAAVLGLTLTGESADPLVFSESFDGAPTSPQPAKAQPWASRWDLVTQCRNRACHGDGDLSIMQVGHGADCAPPPASHESDGDYEDTIFQCRDHVMTAISAGGYGLTYMTPNHMADWTEGEAVVSWRVSTQQTSGGGRDWFDVWLSPFEENLIHPLDLGFTVDLQGPPKNALHFKMTGNNGDTRLCALLFRDYTETFSSCSGPGWNTVLTPSATVRSLFEIRVSRDHLKVWMPEHGLVWYDGPIPTLSWSQAVVQFGHHSYNPNKADAIYCTQITGGCRANTWHWDDVKITRAVPFTLVKTERRSAGYLNDSPMTLAAQAPPNAFLRFSAFATIEVSYDGTTYTPARVQGQLEDCGKAVNYWMSVPEGTSQVWFREGSGDDCGNSWQVKDVAIFARPTAPPPVATPTPTAAPTVAPTPTPTATPTPTVSPTSSPTPVPVGTCEAQWRETAGSTPQVNQSEQRTSADCRLN